jgi:putative colanic acid biosysnthesis UDP-glucose lipid carrier transferase
MLVFNDTHLGPVRSQPGLSAIVGAVIEPAVAIASLLASVIWFDNRFDGPYLILALLVFLMMFPGRLLQNTAGNGELTRNIATSWAAIVALLLLLGWSSETLLSFDLRSLAAWIIATPFALFAANKLFVTILPRVLAAESLQKTAVIAGRNPLGARLADSIRANPMMGIRLAGCFDDRNSSRLAPIEPDARLGSLSELAEYVKTHRVEVIYITLPMASQPRVLQLLEALRDTTASIYFVPDIFLFDLIQARMETIGSVPVLAVCESPFCGINALIKPVSDILLASIILPLILPLMAGIAIGVKISSPGPVLFRQRRYGLDGREIVIYKFRTMHVLEDGDVITQVTRDDRRVTRFGAFLRKYSLDELPQFINVLQGRMSVVGPRPHAVAHNEMYRKLIRGYMIRHKVKPGITGLAQVSGLRGETDTLDKMRARIDCDLAYLRNWSLLLDMKIVLKTAWVILGRQNTY